MFLCDIGNNIDSITVSIYFSIFSPYSFSFFLVFRSIFDSSVILPDEKISQKQNVNFSVKKSRWRDTMTSKVNRIESGTSSVQTERERESVGGFAGGGHRECNFHLIDVGGGGVKAKRVDAETQTLNLVTDGDEVVLCSSRTIERSVNYKVLTATERGREKRSKPSETDCRQLYGSCCCRHVVFPPYTG